MAHTYRNHYFHLIWSTKKRQPFIDTSYQERLYQYIGGIIRKHGANLIEIGGVSDHVHLLIMLGNLDHYSALIRMIKADSSRWVHKEWKDKQNFAWQDGYGSFAISYSHTDAVREYIKTQEDHHKKVSFETEYIHILEKNGVEYDPRYVFD
jgi:putative transposase